MGQERARIAALAFLDDELVDVPCPRCGYAVDVWMIDIRLGSRVFCPCCKVPIQLVDQHAQAGVASRQLEEALRRLGFGD